MSSPTPEPVAPATGQPQGPAPAPAPAPTTAPAPGPASAPAPAAPAPAPAPAVERPDGVSEAEWAALGDPGKSALVRERARANAAEQALAAARARPTAPPAPRQAGEPAAPEAPKEPAAGGGQPDLAAIVQTAVSQAVAPILEAGAQDKAEQAADRIVAAVTEAAGDRFYDPTDAITGIDLPSVTDGNGQPDPTKIAAAVDGLLARKPHLAKPFDERRHALPGGGVGAGGATQLPLDDRVKATLARMQSSTGVKFAEG